MNFVKRVHFLDALLLFSEAGLITSSVSWKTNFPIYGVFSFFFGVCIQGGEGGGGTSVPLISFSLPV